MSFRWVNKVPKQLADEAEWATADFMPRSSTIDLTDSLATKAGASFAPWDRATFVSL